MQCIFFFQAEDGIRDLVRSRGLGDVYKRQEIDKDVVKSKINMESLPEVIQKKPWWKFW